MHIPTQVPVLLILGCEHVLALKESCIEGGQVQSCYGPVKSLDAHAHILQARHLQI